ncbi:Embryogenesis-associated protein [Nymphaea thermarum]|nr:Embryogenesis-associated protein [Nymphaea thermarum]
MSAHILSRLLPRVRAGASVPSASGSADIHPSLEVIGGDRFPLQALGRSYRPFPLIGSNRHVETIFAAFFRSLPDVRYRRECLRTAEGGALALDWPVGGDDQRLASDAPVLILLLYSASFTEDLRQVVYHVGHCFPYSKLYAAGWSLGANILVRYLGQEAHSCPLAGAASLCNPFDLVVVDEDFHKGFNVIYDKALARAVSVTTRPTPGLGPLVWRIPTRPLAVSAPTLKRLGTRTIFSSMTPFYKPLKIPHNLQYGTKLMGCYNPPPLRHTRPRVWDPRSEC